MRRLILAFILVVLLMPADSFAVDLGGFMPEKVGELKRIQIIEGDAAQGEVDKLHGKALPAEGSVVARYSRPENVGKGKPAEVWLSQVSSETEARRQTGQMVHMMYENPQSPFKNPKRIEYNGQAIYRFTGMGQAHYIWFKGDLVYWISANPADETTLLDVFCK